MLNTNLIVDGNYLLYKSVFILNRVRTLYGDLETLLLKDYNTLSREFPFNVTYFVSDSKTSWRKIIYKEYKEGRVKDNSIDWDFVFDTYDTFKETIKSNNNCLLYEIDQFEGDDIISHIVRESNKEGYSNVIISSDGDIHQLLDFNLNKEYINIMYNHKFNDERIFVPIGYEIFINHIEENSNIDIFDLDDDQEFIKYFNKIKTRAKVIEIDKEKSLLRKLLEGDSGDNILSIAKKDKSQRGIGKAGSEKVYNMYKLRFPGPIDFNSDDFLENLSEIVSIYKKDNTEEFKKMVKENTINSRKLISLDSKYLPSGMYEILKENIKI